MKMITAVTNTGFARYVTIEVAGTLKANGGDIGGGSENLVICRRKLTMTYHKVTGPLMANSHPGSYCGQDAYSDMLVTECKECGVSETGRKINGSYKKM